MSKKAAEHHKQASEHHAHAAHHHEEAARHHESGHTKRRRITRILRADPPATRGITPKKLEKRTPKSMDSNSYCKLAHSTDRLIGQIAVLMADLAAVRR